MELYDTDENLYKRSINHKLHYAPLNLKGDIPSFTFSAYFEFVEYVEEILERTEAKVFLLAWDQPDPCINGQMQDEVIVTGNDTVVSDILESLTGYNDMTDIETFYLQEYATFEEAYKVALSMRENSPYCYEDKPEPPKPSAN